jgi:hypothetical protein
MSPASPLATADRNMDLRLNHALTRRAYEFLPSKCNVRRRPESEAAPRLRDPDGYPGAALRMPCRWGPTMWKALSQKSRSTAADFAVMFAAVVIIAALAIVAMHH